MQKCIHTERPRAWDLCKNAYLVPGSPSGAFWCLWCSLALPGSLWRSPALSAASWRPLAVCGAPWSSVALPGTLWCSLALCDAPSRSVALPCDCLALPGASWRLWRSLPLPGDLWRSLVLSAASWRSRALCGASWRNPENPRS